jgi:hypothetical protein
MRYEPKPYELPLALLEGMPRIQKMSLRQIEEALTSYANGPMFSEPRQGITMLMSNVRKSTEPKPNDSDKMATLKRRILALFESRYRLWVFIIQYVSVPQTTPGVKNNIYMYIINNHLDYREIFRNVGGYPYKNKLNELIPELEEGIKIEQQFHQQAHQPRYEPVIRNVEDVGFHPSRYYNNFLLFGDGENLDRFNALKPHQPVDPRDAYRITPENTHKPFYRTWEEGEEGRKRRSNRRSKRRTKKNKAKRSMK